jgi:DNA-binding MarR family transcriptional regulator
MRNTVNHELIHNLVKNFSKLERRQRHFMKDALKPSGLQGMMYKYIITIKRHPGTSQDFLAEFHSVDKSRVTRVVRELEKMGCLSRLANENDRRSYRLFLTPVGERLFDTIQKILMEWGTIISKNIPAGNISVTIDTIEKMINNRASAYKL